MRQSVVRRGQDTGSSWLRQNCFRELFTLIEGCWMDRFCARVFLLSLCLLIVACRCRCRRLLLVVVACCYLSLSHVLLLVGICIYLPLTIHPLLQSQQTNPNRRIPTDTQINSARQLGRLRVQDRLRGGSYHSCRT